MLGGRCVGSAVEKTTGGVPINQPVSTFMGTYHIEKKYCGSVRSQSL